MMLICIPTGFFKKPSHRSARVPLSLKSFSFDVFFYFYIGSPQKYDRPSHWNRTGDVAVIGRRTITKNKIRRPKSLLLSTSSLSTPHVPGPPRRKSMVPVSTLWKDHCPSHHSNKENDDRNTPTHWSFQPSFVASMPRKDHPTPIPDANDHETMDPFPLPEDDIELDRDAETRYHDNERHQLPLPKNHQDTVPTTTTAVPSQRRSASTSPPRSDGALVQQLQRLRRTIRGDAVRLSSGQYPCAVSHNSSKTMKNTVVDRNDPRNRATTVVDVTIVGDNAIPDGNLLMRSHQTKNQPHNNQNLVTLPCYVHHHWTNTTTNDTSTANESSRNWTTTSIPTATFAFIVLTLDTMVSQNIRNGSQLRIYSAIYIPTMPSIPLMDATNAVPTDSNPHNCRGYIVCTQLCESYANTKLPALVVPNHATVRS